MSTPYYRLTDRPHAAGTLPFRPGRTQPSHTPLRPFARGQRHDQHVDPQRSHRYGAVIPSTVVSRAANGESNPGSQTGVRAFVDSERDPARQHNDECMAREKESFITTALQFDLDPCCMKRARTRDQVFDHDQPPTHHQTRALVWVEHATVM